MARFSPSPAPLQEAQLEAIEPELVTDEGGSALELRPSEVPRMQLARSLDEAGPRTFVYVDGKGRVRSPARYRAVQAAGYAALGAVVLGGTALYTSIFGPPGALVGVLFGAAAGRSLLLTREINQAALLSSHDRLDEAELILRRLLKRRMVARRLRALAHHNLGAVATRRGDHAEALDQLRRAIVLYHAAWRKSPHLRSCQYGEIIALCNLGREGEARQRLRALSEVPEGDYLIIKHWTTQLYVDFCAGAFDRRAYGDELWDRAKRALKITSSSALLALCAWGFDSMGEHDMAWHVLGEAYDRLEGVPLLRTMPPLWRWMERARPKALAASSSLDTGGARGRGHG